MNKYLKRPADEHDNPNDDGLAIYNAGCKFRCGSAYEHAGYLIEMSRRHPIMYWIWYRWWVPLLLHKDERQRLDGHVESRQRFGFRPYWADFALYHPVQFLVFLLLRSPCLWILNQPVVVSLTAPIKIIGRVLKLCPSKNSIDNIPVEHVFVEEDSNVPSDAIIIKRQPLWNV